jgi:hypothetical protein
MATINVVDLTLHGKDLPTGKAAPSVGFLEFAAGDRILL